MATRHTASDHPADKYYFLVRRLHSLSGLIPLGVFLCFHLLANSTVLAPADVPGGEFQRSVERIHALGPFVVPVEIIGIFVPLLFHALLGFQIWFTSQPNAQYYRYGGNYRYTLQRVTGVVAFLFILFHVWQLHWLGAPLGGGRFAVHNEAGAPIAAVTTAKALQAAWWVAPVYAIGILCAVFHLANGVWTSLITWGITIRPQSQRVAGYACAALGLVLAIVGLGALSGFRTFDVSQSAMPSPTHTASAEHAS